MAMIEVSESEARKHMQHEYAGMSLGRRVVDYQSGAYSTQYTLNGDTVLEIYNDPDLGIIWKINK